jgi:hypothetical protein
MIPKMPTVKGYSIRLVVGDEARRRAAVEYVIDGLANGALKPVIDRIFKFDDMVEVHRYLENSGQFARSSLPFEPTKTGISNTPAPRMAPKPADAYPRQVEGTGFSGPGLLFYQPDLLPDSRQPGSDP